MNVTLVIPAPATLRIPKNPTGRALELVASENAISISLQAPETEVAIPSGSLAASLAIAAEPIASVVRFVATASRDLLLPFTLSGILPDPNDGDFSIADFARADFDT